MSLSLVSSVRAPETIRVHDEEWTSLYDDTESVVLLKNRVTAGDQEAITELTYKAVLKNSDSHPGVQEMETQFALHRASIATAAVMIVGFEGPLFEDVDTGRTLVISGTLDNRMDAVRRLPYSLIQFVDREVAKLNASPLPIPKSESGSKKGSRRASTPDSDPKTEDSIHSVK